MAQLDISRGYSNGEALLEADLDLIRTDIITFVNTTKLNDDNIQSNSIDADVKLVNATVTAALIQAETITSAKIAPLAITTAKIINDAVTTAKIADLAVTNGKLDTAAIPVAKFADNSITVAKRATPVKTIATTAANVTSSSTSEVDVTNATVDITTTGKAVMVYLQHQSTTSSAGLRIDTWNQTPGSVSNFRVYRDATPIGYFPMKCAAWHDTYGDLLFPIPAGGITLIDAIGAGTYTYKVTYEHDSGSTIGISVLNAKLVAYEIL